LIDGFNVYQYSRDNPCTFFDSTGFESEGGQKKIVLPHKFTGKESVEDLHKFARERGFDFEGTPKWTGKYWDVGTLHQIAKPKGGAGSKGSEPGPSGSSKEPTSSSKPGTDASGPSNAPDGPSSTTRSFARGFLKGLVVGLAAGLVIGAMIASGGTLAIVGGALAVGGAGLGGLTLGQVITGETLSGRKLTPEERAEMGGELLGGTVGGALGGAAGGRLVTPTDTVSVDPTALRYSQNTAGGRGRADALRVSMGEKGYAGDPIDVVQTEDGLVTIDNTRPAVAAELGIKPIPARVHAPSDPLPPDMVGRFGDAKTWGEALTYRTANQRPPLPPSGSTSRPRLPKPKN
jgi:hypothetical protein